MSGVNPANPNSSPPITGAENLPATGPTGAPRPGSPPLPPINDPRVLSFLDKNPELAAPLLASGLALEILMEALGAEERKTVIKTSTAALKAKAAERKEANDKQLDEIKTRLEKMEKQKTLNSFLKVFKIIGLVVGVIAAAATIVAGFLTANPLLIAGGAVLGALAVDSIVGMASDGKYGLAQGVGAALKAMGVSEKTAAWVGMAVVMAIAITGAVLSFGGAAAASSAMAATTLAKANKIASLASNIVGAANSIAQGGTGIAASLNQYGVEQSRIRSKELEAVLARIQEATEVEQEFLKSVLRKFDDILTKINELVKANNETMAQVLGGDGLAAPGPA